MEQSHRDGRARGRRGSRHHIESGIGQASTRGLTTAYSRADLTTCRPAPAHTTSCQSRHCPLHNIATSHSSTTNKQELDLTADNTNRDRDATIEATVHAERRRLLDFIRKRVRNQADAEDILQDVFYQLVASYSITEPIEKLTAWLFTVTRNRIVDWYRKRKSELTLDDKAGRTANLEDILFDPNENPDEVYARSLVWTELADALDELPDEQREVFVMHELEGRSFREIADRTGEPVNTLLSRKRYAVLFLRERLQELYEGFFNQ